MLTDFYKGKRVLVTGHTGFKGAWLAMWLRRLGAEVWGYSLSPPTNPNLFDLCRVGDLVESRLGDVREYSKLFEVFRNAKPEIVFHLAAQPLVREGYREPVRTFDVNVMGTVGVLSACLARGVTAAVIVTSDKVYDPRTGDLRFSEDSALGGDDPYSASKVCAELVARAYRRVSSPEPRMGIATARAGNVFGGGDFAEGRLVPDFLRALIAGRPVTIRMPNAVRPWQHVLNPLHGYLLLGKALFENPEIFGRAYNFGPDSADSTKSVQEFLLLLFSQFGRGALELRQDADMVESRALRIDSSWAMNTLDWRPAWNLKMGIVAMKAWVDAWQSGHDLRKVCLKQIRDYEQSVKEETK